jgi:hypothetical protein
MRLSPPLPYPSIFLFSSYFSLIFSLVPSTGYKLISCKELDSTKKEICSTKHANKREILNQEGCSLKGELLGCVFTNAEVS